MFDLIKIRLLSALLVMEYVDLGTSCLTVDEKLSRSNLSIRCPVECRFDGPGFPMENNTKLMLWLDTVAKKKEKEKKVAENNFKSFCCALKFLSFCTPYVEDQHDTLNLVICNVKGGIK